MHSYSLELVYMNPKMKPLEYVGRALSVPRDRDLHSSSSRLNGSTFCGISWVVSVFQYQYTSHVVLRSGRVHSSTFRLKRSTVSWDTLGGLSVTDTGTRVKAWCFPTHADSVSVFQ